MRLPAESPAAVESAAANPPAATSAMTQLGNFAISGWPAQECRYPASRVRWYRDQPSTESGHRRFYHQYQQPGLLPVFKPRRTLLNSQMLAGLLAPASA